nr:PREDICTED: NADPH oxidase 5 [Anolis carolinensis]|eukprot:XP_016852000.1 PREDICTED: NADPH oxidase 5 [Anolis carolinensis]
MNVDDDAKWLEWVAQQFESIAGKDKEIDLEEFKTALNVKESFFAERFFALFDSDGSGTISLDELLEALKLLIHGSEADKLRFLFHVYDVDDTQVVMLRRCLTWLRATWAAKVLPLDQSVLLHRLIGCSVAALSVLHTGAHVANFVRLSQTNDIFYLWEYLFTTRTGIGWVYGTASVTGLALQLLIGLMSVCSSTFVRKSGHFEVFYWTHLSYVFIWTLLIIHGPNFWKWFVVPGFLFLVEKIFGVFLSRTRRLYIVEINLLPSKVTHLVIQRPPFFHYKPGDYVYLNIPAIAKYEWHPFTISSAPEQPGTIWLHIRSLGQWTNQLYEYFWHQGDLRDCEPDTKQQKKTSSEKWKCLFGSSDVEQPVARSENEMVEILSYRTIGSPNGRTANEECYIDGPYGTPTRRIFTSEHAVLIGAGIGITPFASILQSIMFRHHMQKQTSRSQDLTLNENLKNDNMKLQKVRQCLQLLLGMIYICKALETFFPHHQVDFIWINRDQTSFEWFVRLLMQLEGSQADEDPSDRFLEMHLYMTSALNRNDMKAIGLQVALDLLAEKEKKDSITGLKTRTQPGRPNWNKLFQKLAKDNKGKVHVFFCGSPALAKVIKGHCEQFGFRFFKENF